MNEISIPQAENEFEAVLLEALQGPVSHDGVTEFEDEVMRQCAQVQLETHELLHGGIYCRTVRVPAGVMMTGALLTRPNIAITSGHGVVNTDEGMVELKGFHVFPSDGGQKRIGWAKEESYFTLVMRTDAKTVEEAEREMTTASEYQKLQTVIARQKALGGEKCQEELPPQ